MKTFFSKILIGIAVSLIICGSSQSSENNKQQELDRIKYEKLVHIENWYAQRLDWLMEAAELRANELPLPLRRIWTEFVKMSDEEPFADTYYLYANLNFLNARHIIFRDMLRDAYFLDKTRNILMRSDVFELLNSMIYSSVTSDKLRYKSIDLLHIMEEFQTELTYLEKQKQIRLEEYEQWAKNLQPVEATQESKVKPQASQIGIVSAINFDGKNAFGMIDDKIVYPQSIIHGVKVINIHRYKIEFQKNGKLWAQQIGGPADSAWHSK